MHIHEAKNASYQAIDADLRGKKTVATLDLWRRQVLAAETILRWVGALIVALSWRAIR